MAKNHASFNQSEMDTELLPVSVSWFTLQRGVSGGLFFIPSILVDNQTGVWSFGGTCSAVLTAQGWSCAATVGMGVRLSWWGASYRPLSTAQLGLYQTAFVSRLSSQKRPGKHQRLAAEPLSELQGWTPDSAPAQRRVHMSSQNII